ncbi:hypothetical protein JH146_0235 [Methanocaldococcus bathoardescens]|uniref:Lipoprotein n=1 Tax=Methanocaldococcus bathoardescens TaxID=1301915 RepID=A0A076LA94_9EURY|nr:hypothetical protein [Methanocaldococcus bathoardescens]AIJ05086.1 hypothetical protein JH146_0235 [Methanocaldococcus bathoardescens]
MRKLIIFFLSLILIASICGCFNNGKKEINELNISAKNENIQNHKNISIENPRMDNLKDNNKINITNNESIANNMTNDTKETKKYDFSKQIDIDEMFLNLPYEKTIEYEGCVIKKYSSNGFTVTFEVSTKPIDFSYAYIYNEVKKYPQRDAFGDYTYYEFIPRNVNLSISYCYYREVGNYYIVMQTYEKSKRANDLWINWTKHIFSLFEE